MRYLLMLAALCGCKSIDYAQLDRIVTEHPYVIEVDPDATARCTREARGVAAITILHVAFACSAWREVGITGARRQGSFYLPADRDCLIVIPPWQDFLAHELRHCAADDHWADHRH